LIAFSLALMCGGTVAHAQQTVISRQISDEPVETTVTQGPYGTVITRRPLDTTYQRVVPSGYGTVTVRSVRAPTVAIVESDDDDDVETVTVRRTRTVVETAPARRTVRTVSRRAAPPIMARAVELDDEDEPRPAVRVRRVRTAPLALQPAQREIIYRTIVRERVYAPAPQPVVTYTTPYYGYAYAPRPVAYTVGTVVPQTIQLAGVPSGLAVQVPATRGYQYAVVNNRVLLIDPATGIIVADVTP
jgi:hypothetical protein